jgi:hypothetical protein
MTEAEVLLQVELSSETLSQVEVSQAIGSLTAEHKTMLVKIAKAYAWKTRYGYEDLIQEAFTRVLEGKRAWPRKLPAVVFLRGVMRSIASDWPLEGFDGANVDEIGSVNHAAAARIDARKMLALFDDEGAKGSCVN